MKVSICVPVYKVEKYIGRCARSIFEQTYHDLEIVFVDDCSPDNSIAVLSNVIAECPLVIGRVKIVRHSFNRGLAAARNTAVENATGDYLIWVDSDDFIEKTLVEQCVHVAETKKCDIVLYNICALYNNYQEILNHTKYSNTKERTIGLLSRQTILALCGGMYKLSLYKDNSIKAVEGINNNEDYQVSPRLSYYSKSVEYIDDFLYYYDCRNCSSITKSFSVEQAEQGWKSIDVLKKFFSDKGSEYIDALKIAEINRLATYIKWSVRTNNRDYYGSLRLRQQRLDNKCVDTVPFAQRPFLVIDCFLLLRFYSIMGTFMKKCSKRLHNYEGNR